MTDPFELREYSAISVELDSEAARALATAAKDRLRITVDGGDGRYRIESFQYVGSVVVPGASVLVRPKVPLENVFLLMEAIDSPEWRSEDFGWDAHAGMLPAFAAFFARTLERAVGLGLYRSYRSEEDLLPTMRGRIDIAAQLRRPGVVVPIACRFDEFTADVLENRALKAALLQLTRTPGIPLVVHRRLRRLRTFFDEVSDVHVDPGSIKRIHLHRLNQRYAPALHLAELVLRNLSLADRSGVRLASSFMVDMNMLFQEFVTARLRKLLRRRLDVEAEPSLHLGERRKVRMLPDLVFNLHGTPMLVGDTKYKLLGEQLGRNSDYYQMLAYTTALDLPEGVLIYATQEGGAPDHAIDVRHTGKRLWTYPLDLTGTTNDVGDELQRLSEWILDHSRSAAAQLVATA